MKPEAKLYVASLLEEYIQGFVIYTTLLADLENYYHTSFFSLYHLVHSCEMSMCLCVCVSVCLYVDVFVCLCV